MSERERESERGHKLWVNLMGTNLSGSTSANETSFAFTAFERTARLNLVFGLDFGGNETF